MALFNFNLQTFFNRQDTGEDRWNRLSRYLSVRLTKAAEFLDERELTFEAGDADDLARKFVAFAESSGSAEEFAELWEALTDWAEGSVVVSGREKSLCTLPTLPHTFAC